MLQIVGNPSGSGGVSRAADTIWVPQLRQNDDPDGLSCPQAEQRMSPLIPCLAQTKRIGNGVQSVCNPGGVLVRGTSTLRGTDPQERRSFTKASWQRCAHRIAMALLVFLTAACGGLPTRAAPFRIRPDAAEIGSLRGPFNGRVIDATTRAPIAGALIYAAWTFERGSGLHEPAGAREFLGSTDEGGNYRVPRSNASHPPGARITEFVLLVYKRGYIAYRSDRRFNDLGLRMDFAQSDNQVLLERWRNELSHVRHLRFLGSGAAIAALTQWELAEAATELTGKSERKGDLRPGRSDGPYVVAAQLLTDTEIKALTKYDGQFETGPLADEPDTATYSSQHFKALNHAETWDVAVRVWRLDAAKARERYDELASQMPGIAEKDEIANRSFRAAESNIRGVGFLDVPRGAVVLLTCGSSQCASEDDAVALARLAHAKLKQLISAGSGPAVQGNPQ